MKIKLILFLSIFGPYWLNAYPIPPQPLRMLVMESKYIVFGFVDNVEEANEPGGNGKQWSDEYSVATIRVREVLQGQLAETSIKIRFSPYMICPASDVYRANTVVIVFLDQHEDGSFYVPALSYGAKTLPQEGIDLYVTRIKEMQSILKVEDKYKQFMEMVAWLVRCAEHEYTRWEGTFELSPESDFMSFYSRKESEPFRLMLNNDDKSRLRNALLKQSIISYDDLGLVDLVYMGTKDEVYDRLLQTLKVSLKEKHWYAGEIMERLTYANPGFKLKEIIRDYENLEFDRRMSAKGRSLIKKFIASVE